MAYYGCGMQGRYKDVLIRNLLFRHLHRYKPRQFSLFREVWAVKISQ